MWTSINGHCFYRQDFNVVDGRPHGPIIILFLYFFSLLAFPLKFNTVNMCCDIAFINNGIVY